MKKILTMLAVLTLAIGSVTAAITSIGPNYTAGHDLRLPNNKISLKKDHPIAKVKANEEAQNDNVFFESFEYDDAPGMWVEETADLKWLPDGWTRASYSQSATDIEKWYAHPFEHITLIPCYDGNYVMAILYSSEPKDEWIISPEITIENDQYLTFGWYYLPLYFWTIDRNHVDFDNLTFTKREISATMKVNISVDGGDWKQLKDMSDDFIDMDYEELSEIYPDEMFFTKISLAEYAGHTVKIAFQYVGADGNSMFIDGVSVNNGLDRLDALYMPPLTSLYVGGTVDMDILEQGVQVHPSNVELTWNNFSKNEVETSYSWTTVGGLPVCEEDSDHLKMKFSIPVSYDNNPYELFLPPLLNAKAKGVRGTSYAQNVVLMAGGKPEFDERVYGLLPFDIYNDGINIYTEEPADFGLRGVPIFGYSDATDDFWRLYTCGGDEDNLSHIPYAYVSGIINAIIPTSEPLVVNGAWIYGIGNINEDAKFTCSIHALTEEGEIGKALTTKTITGKDILQLDTHYSMFYYSLPFTFDEPVILDESGTDGDFYVIMLTGFHDGGVDYFAPFMQVKPNPYEACLGFYQIEYMFADEHVVALSYVADHKNEYGDMYCAFAMNLDAQYPWLECDKTEIDLDRGDKKLALNSFYKASELRITLENGNELPQWLKVTGYGRLDKAFIEFEVTDNDATIDSNLLISAPGVSKTVHIKKTSGIIDIMAGEAGVKDAFDIMGRKINPEVQTPGFYIIRHSDGTNTKTLR